MMLSDIIEGFSILLFISAVLTWAAIAMGV